MDSPFLSRATLAEKIILQIDWRILPENRFYNMELHFFYAVGDSLWFSLFM